MTNISEVLTAYIIRVMMDKAVTTSETLDYFYLARYCNITKTAI
jgi:hypothetical protein